MSAMSSGTGTRVAVVGAGLMGHGIAQAFMVAGVNVCVWDPDPETLDRVPARIAEHLALLGETRPVDVRLARPGGAWRGLASSPPAGKRQP